MQCLHKQQMWLQLRSLAINLMELKKIESMPLSISLAGLDKGRGPELHYAIKSTIIYVSQSHAVQLN